MHSWFSACVFWVHYFNLLNQYIGGLPTLCNMKYIGRNFIVKGRDLKSVKEGVWSHWLCLRLDKLNYENNHIEHWLTYLYFNLIIFVLSHVVVYMDKNVFTFSIYTKLYYLYLHQIILLYEVWVFLSTGLDALQRQSKKIEWRNR